jgi:hypothetical protein
MQEGGADAFFRQWSLLNEKILQVSCQGCALWQVLLPASGVQETGSFKKNENRLRQELFVLVARSASSRLTTKDRQILSANLSQGDI